MYGHSNTVRSKECLGASRLSYNKKSPNSQERGQRLWNPCANGTGLGGRRTKSMNGRSGPDCRPHAWHITPIVIRSAEDAVHPGRCAPVPCAEMSEPIHTPARGRVQEFPRRNPGKSVTFSEQLFHTDYRLRLFEDYLLRTIILLTF